MDLTRRAHDLVQAHFIDANKNTAVDATCGNGFDTVFLAELGFINIVAIDIQAQAIENTQARLYAAGLDEVELIQDGHQNLAQHVNQPIDCAMFNFGYLPDPQQDGKSNKEITTQSDTSISALKAALSLLSKDGLITLMCYPGHPQGAHETTAIKSWLSDIDEQYKVETHLAKSPKPTAPILFTIANR